MIPPDLQQAHRQYSKALATTVETGSHAPLTVTRTGEAVTLAWPGNHLVIPATSFDDICRWHLGLPAPAPAKPQVNDLKDYQHIHAGM